jgi:hypothetical protein
MSQTPGGLKTPPVPKNSGTNNFKSVFNTTNIKNIPQKLPSMLDRILESKVTKVAGKVLLPATIALEAYLGQSRPEFQGTSLTGTQKGATNAATGMTLGVVDFIGNAFIDPWNEILKVQNKAAALLLGEGNFQTSMIGNLETQAAVNSKIGTVLEKINADLTQNQIMDAALMARFGTLDPSSKVEGGNLPAARFSSAFPDNYGRMRGNITPGGEMNALDAIAADNLVKAIADARATGIPPVAIATADNNSINNSNTQVTTINGATSASDTAFDLYQLAH